MVLTQKPPKKILGGSEGFRPPCWDNYKDSSKQITKVTNSSLLVGQTASGPPSYIQVRHPGADFRGPGVQKHQFKDQKPPKRVILSPLSDLLQTL